VTQRHRLRPHSLALLALLAWLSCKVRIPNSVEQPGEGLACDTSDACPYPDNACLLAQCLDGQCVFVPAPEGPLPIEDQAAGDCKQLYCDGNGETAAYPAPVDAPAEDGNPCTQASCDVGQTRQRALTAGSACGPSKVCNGSGRCGVCVPDDVRCDAGAVARCDKQGEWSKQACPAAKPVCSAARCVGASELAGGSGHACARFEDGSVRCWGANGRGQLGDAGLPSARAPGWLGRYVELALGHDHACGRRGDGTLECWGHGERGQLGNGNDRSSATAVTVALAEADQVAVGARHSCARTIKGEAHCWGDNSWGQIGSGDTAKGATPPLLAPAGPLQSPPLLIAGLADAQALALSADHSCVARPGGQQLCWGSLAFDVPDATDDDDDGGDAPAPPSDKTLRASPTWVPGIKDVVEVGCGSHHSCARTDQGNVYCWGAGTRGQLGDGAKDSVKPLLVNGLTGAQSLAVGGDFGCVLLQGGSVSCWGSNTHGQLGRGTESLHGEAGPVPGLTAVAKLVVGQRFACALLAAGVMCWGADAGGGSSSPKPVAW
jgi:alpha-tubulin suppressor-like RCC1 family protein